MSTTENSGSGRFAGRVAIVTGATKNPSIGRSIATRLAREGASVVINGRTESELDAAVASMRAEGFAVAGVLGSPVDDGVATRLVDTALSEFGRIDLVANTVGGSHAQVTPMTITQDQILTTISLNTWSALSVIQEAVNRGLGAGGAVVNISSGTVNKTTPSMVAYSMAKASLNAMTRTVARDLAGRGIRVNSVAPGLTKTSATKGMWEGDDGKTVGANVPLQRLTTADDIANAAVFLLSEEAAAITGVNIDVDGGNHLAGGFSPITQVTSAAATTPTR
ncbi:MAG: SDR family NAD(P)-dependent oxidoreductase [Acidimicrobiia bacterium]